MRRWYLLDSDVVGDGFRALCYEGDTLIESDWFNNRWEAIEWGEQFIHDGEINGRDTSR